jgi:hypothetical protein
MRTAYMLRLDQVLTVLPPTVDWGGGAGERGVTHAYPAPLNLLRDLQPECVPLVRVDVIIANKRESPPRRLASYYDIHVFSTGMNSVDVD